MSVMAVYSWREIPLEREILKNHKGDGIGNEAWYWRLWEEIEWKALVEKIAPQRLERKETDEDLGKKN